MEEVFDPPKQTFGQRQKYYRLMVPKIPKLTQEDVGHILTDRPSKQVAVSRFEADKTVITPEILEAARAFFQDKFDEFGIDIVVSFTENIVDELLASLELDRTNLSMTLGATSPVSAFTGVGSVGDQSDQVDDSPLNKPDDGDIDDSPLDEPPIDDGASLDKPDTSTPIDDDAVNAFIISLLKESAYYNDVPLVYRLAGPITNLLAVVRSVTAPGCELPREAIEPMCQALLGLMHIATIDLIECNIAIKVLDMLVDLDTPLERENVS